MRGLVPLIVTAVGLAAYPGRSTPAQPGPGPSPVVSAGRQPRPIAGRYIVVFRDDAPDPPGLARRLAAGAGGALRHVYTVAIKGFAADLPDAAVAALQRNPNVAYIEQDQEVYAVATRAGDTWGLDRIDQRSLPLNATYTYNYTGTGVTAYIIDTGIRLDHTEFGGRAVTGYDAVTSGGTASDCNGHGTHVAGTVGGATYGVARAVKLVAVRVLDCDGSGTTSGVIAGVDWVTANAVKPAVANVSLGGGASTSLDQAVKNSIAAGVSYAIAAGNGDFRGRAQDACTSSPARVPEAITIGATDASDAKASWSNYGNCVDWFAPGVSITSAWHTGGTATYTISGTSMATPHVTGVVALYLEHFPSSTPQQVRDALFAYTTKGVVTSSSTTNNHLLYSLESGTGGGATNTAPTASFTHGSCVAAQPCSFDGSASSDPDAGDAVASHAWTFGDGAAGSGATTTHTFAAAGSYAVTLTVTDTRGATGTQAQTVTVATAPATPGGAALSATGYKVKGVQKADLKWSGLTGTNVDVYRADGTGPSVKIATAANAGAYTDDISRRGGGSYTYKVCEAGTATCSNQVTVVF